VNCIQHFCEKISKRLWASGRRLASKRLIANCGEIPKPNILTEKQVLGHEGAGICL
jgi:hypothetical protein